MIITLKGADFSSNNIGTLSTWSVSKSLGTGATYSGPTSVDKGASLSATVTIATGYELGSAGVTVTMGGVSGSYATVSGNTITIKISSVTGNVVIKVPTKNTSSGSEDSGSSGGDSSSGGSSSETVTVNLCGATQTVVNNTSAMVYTIGKALGGGGASMPSTTGRACSATTALAVSGGESVTLSQPISGVTLTYALLAYNSSGSLISSDNNFLAKAWISTNTTLPSGTKYLLIAFKRGDGSTNFSSSEAELLKTALTIK